MHAKLFFFRQNQIQRTCYNLSRKKIGKLCLVRHAESDHNVQSCCAGYYNGSKPTLNGIEKIRKAGYLLSKSDINFDMVYTSPLQRAVISAEEILKQLTQSKLTTHEALLERNFGAFTGMSKKEIRKKIGDNMFDAYMNNKYFVPPPIRPGHKYYQSDALFSPSDNSDKHQGQSYEYVMNKLMLFLDKLMQDLLNGHNILIVGHSHNLQLLQMLLRRSTFEQGIEKYKIEHATPILFTFLLNADNKLIVKETTNLMETTISDELSRLMM